MISSFKYVIVYLSYLIPFLFFGCQPDIFDHHEAEIHSKNLLLYQINFSLKDPAQAYIEYWANKDSSKLYSDLSKRSNNHKIIVYNLLPETIYNYRIICRSEGKIYDSEIFEFQTDTLPPQLPAFKLLENDYDFNGYILLKVFSNPGALILLNEEAKIVWYHQYDSSVVRPFEYTFDHHVLSLKDSSIIEEITFQGDLVRRINTKDAGIQKFHHELFKNEKDQYVGLTYTQKILDLTQLNGLNYDTIRADGIAVLDSSGRKIWDWNIFDSCDPLEDDSLFNRKNDWGHANSIAYDIEGNYLVSFRDFNQVWKIDHLTGEVVWKLGEDGDFRIEGTEWFIGQHDVHMTKDGYLLMFDNGDHKRGYSRILALDLDEQNYSCVPVIDIKLNRLQTTYRMGSVRMIDDKHLLACSPKKILYLSIYNTKGNMVWEMSGTKDSYKAFYLSKEIIENERWF